MDRQYSPFINIAQRGPTYGLVTGWGLANQHVGQSDLRFLTHLDLRIRSTEDAARFASVLQRLKHLKNLHLTLYSSDDAMPDAHVHQAFFANAIEAASPDGEAKASCAPSALQTFHYTTFDLQNYLELVAVFARRLRVKQLQLDCPEEPGTSA